MRIGSLLAFLVLAVAIPSTDSQSSTFQRPTIVVNPRPPETVPKGTCTQGEDGYLEHIDKDNRFITFSNEEIGQFVADRMKKGEVITLYPQASGLIYALCTCG